MGQVLSVIKALSCESCAKYVFNACKIKFCFILIKKFIFLKNIFSRNSYIVCFNSFSIENAKTRRK